MTKVLILGGTGFIGTELSEFLEQLGMTVVVTSRKDVARQSIIKTHKIDLRNKYAVEDLFKTEDPDYIINLTGMKKMCGGITDVRRVYKDDWTVVENILGSCSLLTKLKRFVTVGSCDEYGLCSDTFIENSSQIPLNDYGEFKLSVTKEIVKRFLYDSFPGVVVRPSVVYGFRASNNMFISNLIHAGINKEEFLMTPGGQVRDFLHIKDFNSAVYELITSGNKVNGNVFNVAYGSSVQLKTVASYVEDILGRKFVKYGAVAYRFDEVMNYRVDISKISKSVNWTPTISYKEGLRLLLNPNI